MAAQGGLMAARNYRQELLSQTALAFGRLVRQKREEKGFTRSRLARLLDVDTQLIQRWETGKRLPLRRSMESLVKVLGIAPEEFAQVISGPTQ
jgi:transcriptional regulator with XRE-family HTH domain